jgi:hypothetical protein
MPTITKTLPLKVITQHCRNGEINMIEYSPTIQSYFPNGKKDLKATPIDVEVVFCYGKNQAKRKSIKTKVSWVDKGTMIVPVAKFAPHAYP